MRYTSHLDLHRTWERTVRRAGLPIAYSQGYNPRPRIQIAAALPLGFTSGHEVVDVWFQEPVEVAEAREALDCAIPPGIHILELEKADLRSPALQTQVRAAEYIAIILEPVPDLNERIDRIQTADSLPRQRRGKSYDLRPLIEEIKRLEDNPEGPQTIQMRLKAEEGATGRPEEVLLEMGISPSLARVERTQIIFKA
jgi:radical SAM-linked protein